MKHISIDNGRTYQTPEQAMPEIDNRNLWDVVVNAMDDDTREAVAYDLAPCSNAEQGAFSLTIHFQKEFLMCIVPPPRR